MREKVVALARSLIGRNEASGSHRYIIDTYNSISPLPVGYRMSYTDPWCAAFVSAVGKLLNLTNIILPECGCDRMIELYKKVGRWEERDDYVPSPGDLVFYDWQDSGIGDNEGSTDHVGIVSSINGSLMVIIEGNISDAVGTRNLQVDGRYIRGYALPDYGIPTNVVVSSPTSNTNSPESDIDKYIWDYLMSQIKNPFGVSGLMGNLFAESGLSPTNLEQLYERKYGYTDATYTAAVDNGSYTDFVHDAAGYGIAQWTYWSRKQNLLAYKRSKGVSIGDLDMQLEFLIKELSESYLAVFNTLKTATTIRVASDAVLIKYENPADKGPAVQATRAAYGQTYYDRYVSGSIVTAPSAPVVAPSTPAVVPNNSAIKAGDIVTINSDAVYYSGASIPSWVKAKTWIVSSVNGARAVLGKSTDNMNNINSPIHTKFLSPQNRSEGVFDAWNPAIGEVVNFTGGVHYGSAMASNGYPCKNGQAKITQIYQLGKSKHPYHLVKIPGGTSTVYGWVDEGTFEKV